MKKLWFLAVASIILLLAACGGNDASSDDADNGDADQSTKITVGASSVPHSEILEEAKPLLEEEGITLEIEQYEDYVLPNDDLEGERIDANFFQHQPFLDQTVKDAGYEIESIGGIHVEPMGVYSKGIKNIEDIPDGTEVVLSNSVSDQGRILSLFEANGLITLDENVDKVAATIDDIVENPKDLSFHPDVAPEVTPDIYNAEEDSLVVINTNFAIGAGLNPLEDALFIEGDESDYVNVIAVRSEDKDNEALNKLVEVLQSQEMQDFMLENYEGAVIPTPTDAK
ncbi:MetQ/NlpA family ABC transporter substrate-binding protein [Oceanobacillus sp. J11TS1]|uniref:MetQ/NlpA family ABC transporter substrate-binding protein n=1 Tax=Oceanobacillus sp. J11TS1 TaxID=2807191 RepID=UPI001B147C65|nr:MetQ/NlpA family ABC transporter substrate-binding protein [Oceanobacillus sp. J11TS1]GIO23712.1 lipoprotein [Oceanobacillus sp. J11TS1]